jgi:hypothetical protein
MNILAIVIKFIFLEFFDDLRTDRILSQEIIKKYEIY